MENHTEGVLEQLPELNTVRLLLRPFGIQDADKVQALAGAKEIYETTLNIPHPYEDGVAEKWIASHVLRFYQGQGIDLAITLDDGTLIGAIGLSAAAKHRRAELGYWIGVPFWNRGYCTEAAAAILEYGFETLNYHKISARYQSGNPASGRVMEKIGMTREGELQDEVFKDGRFHTLLVYGKLNHRDHPA